MRPISRMPGVSRTSAPDGIRKSSREVVVWRPRPDHSWIACVAATSSPASVLRSEVNRGNRIEVPYGKDLFRTRKKGTPIAPDNGKMLNKQRMPGKPALIVEDVKLIKELEDEPACIRRERMLKPVEPKEAPETV